MKDILMIVHTMGNLSPSDNDRFTYIARMLIERGESVEIITSDFEHHKKTYRDKSIVNQHPFVISFLHEKAYEKNISIKRILGHKSFAKELKKYLKGRKKPDVIYCAVPPNVSASVAAKYAEKENIRFVVDVQDLWPEAFFIALGNNFFSKIILRPLKASVDKVYSLADAVIAVSETYVERVKQVNKKAQRYESIYLGTDGEMVDKILKNRSVCSVGGYFA